jgi:glycosyltransferase involved in cell wall biosynthesis
MKLAWNAIVRNEAAVVERCVRSLLPHIDCAIVVDTGSSDDTVRILEDMFRAAGKPLELHGAHFENFEQARNEALKVARESALEWDYLLLADADMELKVKQTPWLNGEKGLSYDIRQRAGSLGYYNRRLVSRAAQGWYVGVTHEYLDVESAGHIDRAEFIDHADGANRPDKFQRDIALLEAALETETREGLIQRYHFYLAGSYYDAGDIAKAAHHYKIRVERGGFDQEVWYAQFRYAQCLERRGDEPGFVREMLRAHQLRPSRGESMYALARYFRDRGDNEISLLFSTPGMHLSYPDDSLFVDEWVHMVGLKEEFAICAWYNEYWRSYGSAVCDELSLRGSSQARGNQYWYLKPLVDHVPSFHATKIELPLPNGWVATNPSIINYEGRPTAIVRTVNYTITPQGTYSVLGSDGSFSRSHPIRTRNYLVCFSGALAIEEAHELAPPPVWPEPEFDLVLGFEDSRLFEWAGSLWALSTVRELTPEGWCEQVLAPVSTAGYGNPWTVIHPKDRHHEKNWMPWVRDKKLDIIYRLGTIMDVDGNLVRKHDCKLDVGHISGSSQVIDIYGVNLALVHEARHLPGQMHKRYYQHRFVVLEDDGSLLGISPPFCFHDKQIEFAVGLAYFPETEKLVASYGVRDSEAWLAEMDVFEVLEFIGDLS